LLPIQFMPFRAPGEALSLEKGPIFFGIASFCALGKGDVKGFIRSVRINAHCNKGITPCCSS
jgi:hypothetical protein